MTSAADYCSAVGDSCPAVGKAASAAEAPAFQEKRGADSADWAWVPGFGSCERSRPLGGHIDYTWHYLLEDWEFTISDAIPAIFAACMARSSFSSFCLLRYGRSALSKDC